MVASSPKAPVASAPERGGFEQCAPRQKPPCLAPPCLAPNTTGTLADNGATLHVRGFLRTLLLADRVLHDENRWLAGEVPHRITHIVEYLAVTNQAIVVTIFPQRQPDLAPGALHTAAESVPDRVRL